MDSDIVVDNVLVIELEACRAIAMNTSRRFSDTSKRLTFDMVCYSRST